MSAPGADPFARARALLGGDVAAALEGCVVQHVDITCDGCDAEPIVGDRFSCGTCEDVDLCGQCMRAIVAARLQIARDAPALAGGAPPAAGRRPRRWVESVRSGDPARRWAALQAAVPCLHPSHRFSRVVAGPERAVVFRAAGDAGDAARLGAFLRALPPSGCSCADVAALVVEAPSAGGGAPTPGDGRALEARVEAAVEDFEALCAVRAPAATDVDALARRHALRAGKWLCFPAPHEADAAWAAAARAAAAGALPGCPSVKVSAVEPSRPGAVLTAYCGDYLDADAAGALAAALRAALPRLARRELLLKPDIFTYLAIYKGSPHGLRPTVRRLEL